MPTLALLHVCSVGSEFIVAMTPVSCEIIHDDDYTAKEAVCTPAQLVLVKRPAYCGESTCTAAVARNSRRCSHPPGPSSSPTMRWDRPYSLCSTCSLSGSPDASSPP